MTVHVIVGERHCDNLNGSHLQIQVKTTFHLTVIHIMTLALLVKASDNNNNPTQVYPCLDNHTRIITGFRQLTSNTNPCFLPHMYICILVKLRISIHLFVNLHLSSISGSGYVFLLLYRLTKEDEYLYQAQKFSEFMQTKEFQTRARTPDSPYSLYEGLAGTVCFYADLLNPSMAAFPFFEVF